MTEETERHEALVARAVRHVRDEEFAIEMLVVADDAQAPTWHVAFERSLEEQDEQGRKLGWDDYCLALTDGEAAYGCLAEVDLQPTTLRLVLTAKGHEELGLDQDPVLALDLDETQHAELLAGLRSVFVNSPSAPTQSGLLAQP